MSLYSWFLKTLTTLWVNIFTCHIFLSISSFLYRFRNVKKRDAKDCCFFVLFCILCCKHGHCGEKGGRQRGRKERKEKGKKRPRPIYHMTWATVTNGSLSVLGRYRATCLQMTRMQGWSARPSMCDATLTSIPHATQPDIYTYKVLLVFNRVSYGQCSLQNKL